jgi:glycerophosphoryl diester phosphodiesterase
MGKCMAKKIWTLVLAIFISFSITLIACNNDVVQIEIYSPYVNSVNHRGYYTAPENTLASFRKSAEMGFTMVECDVQFTKDGYAVILHDNTVDRTSNGTGNINDMTLAEVRSLDFGSWKSNEYIGEKIPTFEEFISLCQNYSLQPYIEIKNATERQVEGLLQVVEQYDMNDMVSWISFSKDYFDTILKRYPSARIGLVVYNITANDITYLVSLSTAENEVFIDCYYNTINDTEVSLCAENKVPLEVWTVDDENLLSTLDPYISRVTSDNLLIIKEDKND